MILVDAQREQEIKRQVCDMHRKDGLQPDEVIVHDDGAITIDRRARFPWAEPITGVLRWKKGNR